MLTITPTARDYVSRIADDPMLPSTAGLRISRRYGDAADGPLNVAATAEPHRDDTVLDYDGARVFVCSRSADSLEDKMLDADLDGDGRIQFAVRRPD
jgi:Fe-S cluster assembly iron-binding protein IscA